MKKITDIAKTTKVQWESLAGPIDDNFDELNNGKLSKDELAQTTGSSTTTAMSQAAVTNEVNQIEDNMFRRGSGGYLPWQANQPYNDGDVVIAPNGQLVECLGGSDGGEEYDPGEWGATTVDAQSRKRDKNLSDSKLSIQDLAETTGTSTKTAMTQKAVTDSLTTVQQNTPYVGFLSCSTAEHIANKAVTILNLKLSTKFRAVIRMTNTNTANDVNLSISAPFTTTKPLYYKGKRASASNTWPAGTTLDVYYDGTNFMAEDYYDNTGTSDFPEAPADGSTYGRKNKGWVKTIGRSGTGNSAETFNNTSNTASGNYAHAEGDATNASGHAAHAEGQKTKATGYASHAEGGSTEPAYQTHAEGKFAHAEGNRTHAAKDASHAEGYATTANGTCSHAEGNKTTATGEDSHAEGNTTNAVGLYAHAEGQNSTAKGQAAHAEGNGTKTGECSTYDSNYDTISTSGNNYGHAEGNNTAAGGMSSHAEGEGSIAFGRASHSEGQSGAAIGLAAHSEGELTMACGEGSHSEGIYTQAGKAVKNGDDVTISGSAAHAEGYKTKALGNHSHAEGYGTKTTNPNEHAQGIFNVSHEHSLADKATSFSIGIGSNEDSRKNGVEVMKNGDAYIIGIGGYDGINIESAKTVQTVISELLGN